MGDVVSPKGFRALARFSLEAAPGVLIYDCTAVESPEGRIFIYGPVDKYDRSLVSLAREVREEITVQLKTMLANDDEQKSAA